jgi:hypothetical protein
MKKAVLAIVFIFCTALFNTGIAQEMKKIKKSKPLGDVKQIEARISFGAGEIEVSSGAEKYAFEAKIEYNGTNFSHQLDYNVRGSTGVLDLRIKSKKRRWFKSHWKKNWFDIRLNPTVPVDLDLNMGACKANIDLTGLKISQLDLSTGASEIDLYFDKPNEEVMRKMEIEAGVGELKAVNLGNANCRKIYFEGGIGDYDLDFSGEWQSDCAADIDLGLGDLTIKIPRSVGVKLIAEKTFLTSLNLNGFVHEDDTYYSEGYDEAKYRLILKVEAGLGSISIRLID